MSLHRPTVYVGMSGGVDSSVSAVLLTEQGYRVVGAYMKNWSRDLPGMKCPWAEDLADAKRVAVKLGIDFEVFDFEKDYKQKVVDYMIAEFKKGHTPNPDIMCNQEIKFKLFYDVAREKGADLIATGHYARIGIFNEAGTDVVSRTLSELRRDERGADPVTTGVGDPVSEKQHSADFEKKKCLLRAIDGNKDQTYFLYRISQDAIDHTIFPIGHLMKPEVKKLAEKFGLDNAYKKESMGVCFVGDVGIRDFLKEYIETEPGPIIDADTGQELGLHDGALLYTIGQRKGLNLGGGLPYYVVDKDMAKNTVFVSQNLNSPSLWTDELKLEDVIIRDIRPTDQIGFEKVFVSSTVYHANYNRARNILRACDEHGEDNAQQDPLAIKVRLRHRGPLIPATFTNNMLHFAEPIKRPAPGQSAVFYAGENSEICFGGGIIKNPPGQTGGNNILKTRRSRS